jgi:hypothetical protein
MTLLAAARLISDPSEAGLRSAATAYAMAFLRGSSRDLVKVLDPACVPRTPDALRARAALGDAELRGFRRLVKRYTGLDAADVKIRSVDVSNYQGRTGDAEAHYGLPTAVEGNDNWNSYMFSQGHRHTAGCPMQAPMFGHGSSSGPDAPTRERQKCLVTARLWCAGEWSGRLVSATAV